MKLRMISLIILAALLLLTLIISVYVLSLTLISRDQTISELNEQLKKDSIKIQSLTLQINQVESLPLTKDNFFTVCDIYGILYPEIVYCQAVLESGNFNSVLFTRNNNFLGLYDKENSKFYQFTHWSYCLKTYKETVQFYFNEEVYETSFPNETPEDRYCLFIEHYLNRDSTYTEKLKRILIEQKLKSNYNYESINR